MQIIFHYLGRSLEKSAKQQKQSENASHIILAGEAGRGREINSPARVSGVLLGAAGSIAAGAVAAIAGAGAIRAAGAVATDAAGGGGISRHGGSGDGEGHGGESECECE